ncbi:family 20 glycosylhydrolase [Hamadaea tsunoensis]|uniref:family 20 glycosylhydrolase n=1 Tax=Hamadaea tsunoensis TaxID=53368 RepID=UPI00042A5F77|nr:family 20 glycosylhydrolase [Hamadaea tsunoensis]
MPAPRLFARAGGIVLLGAALLAAPPTAQAATPSALTDVVPVPASVTATGTTFTLTSTAAIFADAGASGVANSLAAILRPSTGYALPVQTASGTPASGISLLLSGADSSVGAQGYQLDTDAAKVVLRAQTAAGLFAGVQTLRQILPAQIEAATVQSGPWTAPGTHIVDHPRFAYRGAMLDTGRHFFPVATVKRYIDELALYKVNYLHLHLSDDQGWRIVVDAWPRLATYGGSTQVGGGAGGYYTKADYTDLVAYAAARFITVVPEIDMPGHTNAALASYGELTCNGVAPALYTGTDVGFSSLCTSKDSVYTFVNNVLTELAAITPGAYLHIGGDEASTLSTSQYTTFVNRVQPMVPALGKTVIGWHQIAQGQASPGRVLQFWDTTTSDASVTAAVNAGAKVLMSPANKAYLDMKYTNATPLGQDWAGLIEVQTAYGWNPGTYLSGVAEASVLGVEAPLWTETIVTLDNIEYMAFPRLPAIAELGWSPWSTHDWNVFKTRLGAQAPRWGIMGIDFYRSPQVPWRAAGSRYEAENATLVNASVATNHTGYSGSGFVDYVNATGGYVEFTVSSATARTATVTFRYANGTTANRAMTVRLNGTVVSSALAFNGTGSWDTWQNQTLSVNLVAGTNTIRATANTTTGGPNLDYADIP